jgi:cation transport ATPase
MQNSLETVVQPEMQAQADAVQSETAKAERAFSFALLFSGVRCIFMYVVMPFVLPIIGIAGNFSLYLDIVINLVAIAAVIYSLRKFWRIDYKYKWQYTPVAIIALVVLVAFIALDFQELLFA